MTLTHPVSHTPTPNRPSRPARLPRTAEMEDLRPVSLAELNGPASLQTRMDRKYLVPEQMLPSLLGEVADQALVLEIDGRRQFHYRTVYFDDSQRTSYLAATRRRRNRFKVRTRTYLDSGACWLEVKTKDGRGRTVKDRLPYPRTSAGRLEVSAEPFLADSLAGRTEPTHEVLNHLGPVLTTTYRRSTLLIPADSSRVTIDDELLAWDSSGAEIAVTGWVIVECKSTNSAGAMDRLLWRRGLRPIKVSKYATCLAALDPGLPAEKWRPALRRLRGTSPTLRASHRAPTDLTQPEGRS